MYSDLSMTTYPNLAKAVFALFMVFVPILLLNMLIAMMGNTYAHVIEQSEKEWVKQWAKIVVALEQSVAQEDAHRYLQEYSIGLGPSDDPRYEQRAVMVIKSKAKTRGKQRKCALANWKRVGKVTIAELRKRGISGEELRRLMWGRVSISTPTKAPLPMRGPPPPDCVTAAEAALSGEAGNGVGTALSSALNVMAFTEFELGISDGQDPAQNQATPDLLVNGKTASNKPLQTQVQSTANQLTVPQIDPKVNMAPTKSDLDIKNTNSTVDAKALNVPRPDTMSAEISDQTLTGQNVNASIQSITQTSPTIKEEVFDDFLFKLIVLADKTDSNDPRLKNLAEQAANLDHVPVIDVNTSTVAKSARKMVAGAVSELFGVAADTPAPEAGWRRERQDHSDSDPISESVLLGRASRARRARSASRRAAPPPPHLYVPARSMYLVASESSAVESDAPWEDQPSSGNNCSALGARDEAARMKAARPLCIQHATGQAQVEHSLFVIGTGSGAEVESAAPVSVLKTEKRVRPKTARPRRNRVSPVPEVSSPLQPWATAPLNKLSRFIHTDDSSASLSNTSRESSPTMY